MTDIATLGLEIRSDGVVVASDRLKKLTQDGRNAEQATSKLSTATAQLTNYLKAAAAAFGLYKLAELAKESALLAARYQTLGVVMNTVGATAGYTNAQMAGFEKTLQKQGIAMVESRQALTMMAQAHLDLSKAAELGRVAQDAATIGGINSSEAFERMIAGIQKGETEILKTIGINVNFEQSYNKMALALGKSRESLSETEKAQARMNIVLERGKDIAGVYESAMGTAGKQLTSMKRYMDNLKVTAGSVFNDILIVGVQAFSGALKDANTEAEKLAQQNKLAEWGRGIVMAVAAIADGLRFVYNVLQTFVTTAVAGFMQVYKAVEAFSFVLIGDFKGAKQSMQEVAEYGAAWSDIVSKQWTEPINKYQQAAQGMYAARDASKALDEQKRKELEAKQMATGAESREAEKAEQMLASVTKSRDEWAGIVIEQLESVGLYVQAAQEQIRINQLSAEYRDMVEASKTSQEAMNALKAQELLDQQQLAAAKQRELDDEIYRRDAQVAAYQSMIEATRALGQDTKALENDQLRTAYAAKKLEIEYSINEAARSGNDLAESINSQLLSQLDALYAQKDLNSQSLAQLREILGLQRSITDEKGKQNENALDEYNRNLTITRTRDEQYQYDQSILYGQGALNALEFWGATWVGYVRDQAKQGIAEYDNAKRQERLIEEQKKAVESISKASEELAAAATELQNSGKSLVESLRAASRNISAAQVDIAGGAATTLSPEQQYQLAQSMFVNTAFQAQTTGDVELFNALPELAKQFLEASKGYYASGTQFAADYATVQSILGESATSANSYADSTQTVVDLLGTQNEILTDIKAALETGGNTSNLLEQLNTVNGQIKTATDNVNTSVGTVTSATYAVNTSTTSGTSSVTGWLNTLNNTTGGVTTATTSGTSTVSGWLSSVKDQSAATATYTAGTKSRLDASMLGSQLPGRINQATTTPLNAGQTIDWGSKTSYTYYARGGIADDPTGRSIFGEAGPEAAVPLPDGRTIPVTLSYPDNYGFDVSALLVELRSLRAEVNQLRQESVGELKESKSFLRRAVAGR